MHDTLRRRILRKLDTLPEGQLYQVLDYIEFLQSRYATQEPVDPGGLQRWAERLEDGLRKRTVNPGNLREAFQLISAADRVLNSVSQAGRQFLDEFQLPEEAEREGSGSEGSRSRSRPSEAAPGPTDNPRQEGRPGAPPPGAPPEDRPETSRQHEAKEGREGEA